MPHHDFGLTLFPWEGFPAEITVNWGVVWQFFGSLVYFCVKFDEYRIDFIIKQIIFFQRKKSCKYPWISPPFQVKRKCNVMSSVANPEKVMSYHVVVFSRPDRPPGQIQFMQYRTAGNPGSKVANIIYLCHFEDVPDCFMLAGPPTVRECMMIRPRGNVCLLFAWV